MNEHPLRVWEREKGDAWVDGGDRRRAGRMNATITASSYATCLSVPYSRAIRQRFSTGDVLTLRRGLKTVTNEGISAWVCSLYTPFTDVCQGREKRRKRSDTG